MFRKKGTQMIPAVYVGNSLLYTSCPGDQLAEINTIFNAEKKSMII
jgi:hypothetical protein